MVAFGSINTFTPSCVIISKFFKSDELPKSNLYEYPLQPDLSIPITTEST